MSRDIEQRVVQMEFENESFEKKAAQSTKTLEKLDEKLRFKNGTKSFDDVEKAAEKTNFKSLIAAADTVTNKLSNLGIVGVTALTNLTNKAVDAGSRLVKSLTVDQIAEGWNKMDQITKSTGTLISQGYDISEVEAQLDRLNWFTDETSYNLTDMVDNISKFTATGRSLKESTTAIQGIALWAAKSGQNATTASRAMYQMAQALGSGYMRLEDYKSIQNASMDTDEFRQKTLETAVALGTLRDNLDGTYTAIETGKTVTKSGFAQNLTDALWLTGDVMMDVWSQYSAGVDQIYDYTQEKGVTASQAIEDLTGKIDEFGLEAFRNGQEARTFGDAIDSIKDAVSTGWANTFKLIFGNYEQQRTLWTGLSNDLYTLFADPLAERNFLLKEALTSGTDEVFVDKIKAAGVEYEKFKDILIDTATKHGASIDSMSAEATSFEELLSQGWVSGDLFSDAINKYSENLTTTGKTVITAEEQLAEAKRIVDEIFNGEWGHGSERIKRLTEAGYDAAKMQSYVNKVYNNGKLSLQDFSDIEVESVIADEEKIETLKALSEEALNAGDAFNDLANQTKKRPGNELFLEGVSNVITAVIDRVTLFREVMSDIFPGPTADKIYSVIEKFNQLTESMQLTEKRADELTNIFSGIARPIKSLIDLSRNLISVFTPLTKLIRYFGNDTISLLSRIGGAFSSVFSRNVYLGVFDSARNIVDAGTDTIISLANLVKRFGKYVSQFIPKIDVLQSIYNVFDRLGLRISLGFGSATNAIQNFNSFLDSIGEKDFAESFSYVEESANNLLIVFKNLKSNLKGYGKQIATFFSPVIKVFKSALNKLSPYIERAKANFQLFGEFITTYVTGPVSNFIQEIAHSKTPFKTFLDGFKKIRSYVRNIGSGFTKLLDELDFSKWEEVSSDAIKSIKKLLEDLVDFVLKKKDELSFSDVLAAAAGVVSVIAVSKISEAFKKIGDLANTVKGTFSTINSMFKANQLTGFAGNIKAIASSVMLVAISLSMLTLVPQENLWKAAAIIGGITVAIIGFTTALTLISKKMDPKTVAVIDALSRSMIKLALALDLMSLSIVLIGKSTVLSRSTWTKVLQTITLLISMSAVIAGLTFVLSQITTKITVGSIGMIAIALGILLIANSLKKIAQLKIDVMTEQKLQTITYMIMALIGLAALFSQIKITSAVGILGIVGAIELIIIIIDQLKELSFKGLGGKWVEIVAILAMLSAIFVALSVMSTYLKVDTSMLILVGSAIAIIGSIYLLLDITRRLGEFDPEVLSRAANVLFALGILCSMLVVALGLSVGLSKGNKGFMSVALSLGVVVVIMGILLVIMKMTEGLTLEDVTQPFIILVAISALLAALMLAMGKSAQLGGSKGIVYLVGILAAIITLGYALIVLSSFTWDQMIGPISIMIIVMTLLVVVGILLGKVIETATANIKATKFTTLIGYVVLIGVLGAALYMISRNDWKQITAACVGLSVTFLALAGALAILDKVQANGRTIASLLSIAVTLSAVMIAFAFAMSLLPLDQVNSFHEAVLQMLLAVGVLMAGVLVLGAIAGYVPVIGVGMVVVAGVLIMVSAAIIIFAKAMNILDQINLQEMASNLLSIAGGLIAVGIASASMFLSAAGGLALALSFLLLGGAATVCAGGLSILTPVLTNFLGVIGAVASAFGDTRLTDSLADLSNELQNSGQVATETATEIGTLVPQNIAVGLQAGEGTVTGTVQQLNESVNSELEEGKETSLETAANYGNSIVDTITESFKNFDGSKITGFIQENVLSGLSLENVKSTFGEFDLDSIMGQFGTQLSSGTDSISTNLNGALSGIDVSSGMSGLSSNLTSSLTNAMNSIDVTAIQPALVSKIQSIDWNSVMMLGMDQSVISAAITNQFTLAANTIEITPCGEEIGNKFIEAITQRINGSDSLYRIRSAGRTVTNEFKAGAQSVDTSSCGAYMVQGIVDGINRNAHLAIDAAARLAQNCADAINSSLQINSPSKVTYHSGVWIVKGLANAVRDNTKIAIRSTVRMVRGVVSTLNKAIATETVDSPSIAPVLDMTEIYSQIDSIGDDTEWRPIIRPILDMTGVNPGLDNLNAIVRGRAQTEMDSLNQNGSEAAAQNTWAPTFNQYNYSPKPLSRIEIYRQTNNQFSMLKGVMTR